MRWRRSSWVPVTLLVASLAGGAAAIARSSASHAASPGLILFASDRDKADPGEIYSLAPGNAPVDVSRSLAADYGLAVAPVGDQIAFWSDRSGVPRLYLARSDGTHLRLASLGAENGAWQPGDPPAFSADGTKLFISYFATAGTSRKPVLVAHSYVVATRTGTGRALAPCKGLLRPSPDGALVACSFQGRTTVTGLDGRVRFRLRGWDTFWSSRGLLTLVETDAATPPEKARGLIVDRRGHTVATVPGLPLNWTPDGRILAFQRGTQVIIGDPLPRSNSARLLPSPADGSGVSFTPDSRYASTTDNGKPVLVPVRGGPEIQGGAGGGAGVWSPQGRLAYVVFPQQFPQPAGVKEVVYVTDTHGLHPRVAGRFPYDDHAYAEPYWLPSGKRLLYLTSNDCGTGGIYAVSSAGGPTRALSHDARDLSSPAWSPDGTRFAYSEEKYGCHLGEGEAINVETRAADGSGIQQVVSDDGFDTNPAYSRDGRTMAFAHGTFTTLGMQTIDIGGSTPRDLPHASGAPVWSPDGTQIAYISGRSVMGIAPSGGAPVTLAKGLPAVTCGTGGLAWSPDGAQLAFGSAAGISLITLGTPATIQLAIPVPCAGDPSFSPDGKAIAFDAPAAHALGGQTAIMVGNIDGSGIRTLSSVPFRQSVQPSWQPGK
jgi:Tol biopolymer transport system component